MSTRKLAIAIVGPTASGKTKLGVAIAKAYLGEVISVDSLQCYKPGGIITARPLPEETDDVPHHLIDYLEADEEPEDYVSQAVRIMEDISARDGLPILVGGSTSLTMPLLQAAFAREYEVLALTLVPQRSAYQRLVETRGEEMLQRGLLEELEELHRLEKRLLHGVSDLSRGVWKAIGYREYLPYLQAVRSVNGTADGCSSQEEYLREEGRLSMNASTLHYGQDQLEWMRHTLVPFLHRHRAATVSLCVTNKAAWEAEVQGPALTMAGEFCHGASRARHALGFFPKKKRVVCVFGGSSGGHDSSHIDAAKALAVTLHRHDMCLVYGGGTTGIMGAVASTLVALSGPSAVHGVVPAALARYESGGAGDGRVNGEYASRFGRRTVVRDMHTRKRLMTQMVREGAPGSGFVALSGGYGTLEELLEAATWHQLGIHRCGVSVFSVDGFYDGLLDWIRRVAGHGFVGNKDADIIRVARTAEEVVACLDEGSRGGDHGLEWV